MTAALPRYHAPGSCPSCQQHMPNTRKAPSHWPLVTEWRAGKGLLCVREGPEASVIQRVGHSVPTRLSQVSGSTTLGLSAGSKPLLSGLRVTLVWQILMTKEVHTHVQVLFHTSIQYVTCRACVCYTGHRD